MISKVMINLLLLFELGKYMTWHKKQLHSPLYLLFSALLIFCPFCEMEFNQSGLVWLGAGRCRGTCYSAAADVVQVLKHFSAVAQGDSPLFWLIPC